MEKQLQKIATELEALKRLKVFELLNEGHSQDKVARALGTSQSAISRMFSKSPLVGKGGDE